MREAIKVAVRLLVSLESCCSFAYSGVRVVLMTSPFVNFLVGRGKRKKNTPVSLSWSS